MISFTQLCSLLTHNGHYKWFYFDEPLLASLTPEEVSLIHIENCDANIVRIFYPKENYKPREWICAVVPAVVNSKLVAIQKELKAAIAIMDFDEIEKIKQRMKDANRN